MADRDPGGGGDEVVTRRSRFFRSASIGSSVDSAASLSHEAPKELPRRKGSAGQMRRAVRRRSHASLVDEGALSSSSPSPPSPNSALRRLAMSRRKSVTGAETAEPPRTASPVSPGRRGKGRKKSSGDSASLSPGRKLKGRKKSSEEDLMSPGRRGRRKSPAGLEESPRTHSNGTPKLSPLHLLKRRGSTPRLLPASDTRVMALPALLLPTDDVPLGSPSEESGSLSSRWRFNSRPTSNEERRGSRRLRSSTSSTPRSKPVERDIYFVRELGSGGSGTRVYEAEVDGWVCCVKELAIGPRAGREVTELLEEISLMSELPSRSEHSTHLARHLGSQVTDSHVRLFMPLYGGSLDALLHRLKVAGCYLPEDVVAKYVHQLLQGLRILHNAELGHRDLKPSNVFFSRTVPREAHYASFSERPMAHPLEKGIELPCTVLLGDLGEAKKVAGGFTTLRGTPMYAAPEAQAGAKGGQLSGVYGLESDMWGLAQIWTEMMTLEAPYARLELFDAIEAAQRGDEPHVDEEVALRYSQLIPIWRDVLNVEPSARSTISEVLNRLRKVIVGYERGSDEDPIDEVVGQRLSEEEEQEEEK